MSIFKETFKEGVKNQLKARQEAIVERTPSALQYYNSRNAWVRMTSAVNVGGDNTLAKSYVLLGGTLLNGKLRSGVGSSGEAYSTKSPGGKDHRLGIRPMPGITSVEVKSKSAYGSLREAVVNFQCWDLRQLEDLELLYMRPGYSVLIEWGWTPYLDNGKKLQNNITFVEDVLEGGLTKEKIWEKIFNKASTDGNYDAVYGFVKNYNWKARPDGGYDCSTTIITMGEILESLKVNYGPYNEKSPDKGIFGVLGPSYFEKETVTAKAYSQNIIAGICSELYQILLSKGINGFEEKKFNGWSFYCFDVDVKRNEEGNTITSAGKQIYVLLKDFIDILNKHVLIQDLKAKKPLLEVSVFCGKHNGGTTTPLTCLGDIHQLSTNPAICLIKNINWSNPKDNLGIEVKSFDIETTKKIMNTIPKEYDYWYESDYTNKQLGVIGNIYVNLDYIYSLVTDFSLEAQDKKEKNDVVLFDFLKNLMAGVNTSIGNIANFELYTDPVDSIVRIIDINYTGNRKEDWDKAVIIEVQKLGSIVRSYSLESQIFPEQSSIIAIGAQAQGGALGEDVNTLIDFNQNLVDRIVPKKEAPPLPKKEALSAEEIEEKRKQEEETRKKNLQILIDYISKIDPDWWEFKGDFDAGEASKYSNALKDQINYYRNNVKTDNKNRSIIPTKLSLEMDGIGGIIIGNIFRIPEEILPRGYKGGGAGPTKIGYVVTGINHSIQNNDWITRIDAQFIILDEPREGISIEDSKAIKTPLPLETPALVPTYPTLSGPVPLFTPSNVSKVGAGPYPGDRSFNTKYKNGYIPITEMKSIGIGGRAEYGRKYLLHPEAADQYLLLKAAAAKENIRWTVTSAYRSYSHQQSLGSGNTVASAGSSSHGWAGAIDIGELRAAVGGSGNPAINANTRKTNPLYIWLAKNAPKYGWYNPYRLADGSGTDECWHWEYWGPNVR